MTSSGIIAENLFILVWWDAFVTDTKLITQKLSWGWKSTLKGIYRISEFHFWLATGFNFMAWIIQTIWQQRDAATEWCSVWRSWSWWHFTAKIGNDFKTHVLLLTTKELFEVTWISVLHSFFLFFAKVYVFKAKEKLVIASVLLCTKYFLVYYGFDPSPSL